MKLILYRDGTLIPGTITGTLVCGKVKLITAEYSSNLLEPGLYKAKWERNLSHGKYVLSDVGVSLGSLSDGIGVGEGLDVCEEGLVQLRRTTLALLTLVMETKKQPFTLEIRWR